MVRLIWLGARFPLSFGAGVSAAAASTTVLGVYRREQRWDVETFLIAALFAFVAIALWPGELTRQRHHDDFEYA